MKTAIVTMIRNEADILPHFLSHVAEFFDGGYILNHRSTDGSERIISAFTRARPGFQAYDLEFSGYHQREMSNLFLEKAFEDGADLVFFADADEFVDGDHARGFRAQCEELLAFDGIGVLPWQNLCPVSFEDRVATRFPLEVYQGPECPGQSKIVIPKRFYLAHRAEYAVAQGNHLLEYRGRGPAPEVPRRKLRALNHLPIRSRAQLESKVTVGALAYLAKEDFRSIEGFHWFDMLSRSARGELSDDALRGIVARYSLAGSVSTLVGESELPKLGFRKTGFSPGVDRKLLEELESARDRTEDPYRALVKALATFSFDSAEGTASFYVIPPKSGSRGQVAHREDGERKGDVAVSRGSDLHAQLAQARAELDSVYGSWAWWAACKLRFAMRLVTFQVPREEFVAKLRRLLNRARV